MNEEREEYLKSAANAVYAQLAKGISVPVDPEVAEYMGACVDRAFPYEEVIDDIKAYQEKLRKQHQQDAI